MAQLNEVDAFLKELDDSGELPPISTSQALNLNDDPQSSTWNDEEVDQLLAEVENQHRKPPLPERPPAAPNASDRMPEPLQKASQWLTQRLPMLVNEMKTMSATSMSSDRRPSALTAHELAAVLGELQEALQAQKQVAMTPADLVHHYQLMCGRLQTQWNGRFVQQVQAKSSLSDLTFLDMTGASLDYLQAEALALTVPLCSQLRKFVLQNSDIEDGSLKSLIRGLEEVPLTWLNVAFCWNIKSVGVKYIAVLLEKSLHLRYLDVSGVGINLSTASFLAQALELQRERVQEALKANPTQKSHTLEVLKLDMCSLQLDALAELVPGIQNAGIRMLSMRGNGLAMESAMLISPLLAKSTIQKLDVSENHFRAPGLQRLTMTLKEPSTGIRELYLRNCDLESVSLDLLAEVLQTNTTIQLLDLGYNSRICSSVASMQVFVKALVVNQTLKALSLCKTGFLFDSALVFIEAIPDMHLQRLNLLNNDHVFHPLKANMLNLGDMVVRQGQQAIEFLSKSMTQVLKRSQSKNAEDAHIAEAKPSAATGPKPSEQAYAVLSALVAAMRSNKTLTHLEVLVEESTIPSDPSAPATDTVISPQHVQQLVLELRALCGRNVGNAAGLSPSNDQLDVKARESMQHIDAARHSASLLLELLNTLSEQAEFTVTESEQDTLNQLHERCVAALAQLNAMNETVESSESVKDQLGLVQSELHVVLERYNALFAQ
jgi:hypothetical protein